MQGIEDLPLERLDALIVSWLTDLNQRLQRWLELVAEFDRRGAARAAGFRGTAEWLAWRCELSERTARDHVRVARGLRSRPLVRAAFAKGDLSYSKVRALTKVPEGDEEEMLDFARRASAADVERTVRGLRSAPSADVAVAEHAHARRFVDWWWEPDGSLSIRARLTAEDGAALIEAVETGAAAVHPVPEATVAAVADRAAEDGEDGRVPARPPLGARRADALAEICRSGAPRAQVVLHVDDAALACTAAEPEERAGATCAIEHGPAVPSETARRLSCDAELVLARHLADGAGAVDYGRRRRTVPPALRTALERRDGCCRFPGCGHRHDLHAHHVEHWAHGGETTRDNLLLLCRFHHRLVHEGGFTVATPGSGGVEFRDPQGRVVPEASDDLARAAAGRGPVAEPWLEAAA